MKLRIRTKFIGILILASVLPLCIALIAAQTLGYRYYRKAQGTLLQTRAQDLANSISLSVGEQISNLDDWAALSELHALVGAQNAKLPAQTDAEFRSHIELTEARWPSLGRDDPALHAILDNELSTQLRTFLTLHPLFAETFITDVRGQLIAASQKTSDYWQADETWWQRAVRLPFHNAYVEGINYDASAAVYSVDVAVPVRDWRRPEGAPAGVVKGVINASPLLSAFAPSLAMDGNIYCVILADGRILAQLTGPRVVPLQDSITPAAAEKLKRTKAGWMLAPLHGGDVDLVGFAPLRLGGSGEAGLEGMGITPMFLLVHNKADVVLAPVRKQMFMLGAAGALLVLACAFAGYFVAGKTILHPVEAMRAVAEVVGASAKLDDAAPPRDLPALQPLRRIRTGDELEDLAREFASMAGRVLTYHERLESDLAAKTSEIARDLQLAREFQEALMPHSYPRVPSAAHEGKVGLDFHHIYKPASSVGGDFFDVLKLSDHRAGIFIADVMGHGARSALVTAILRALLQNIAFATPDPATFLARLNTHFHEIVRQSQETIFVSAFYLIVDTETATATYASAGHPSPFLASRTTREVVPLLGGLRGNPALGLFPGASYDKWTRVVKPGDLFLLFTDGVHEAYRQSGEEFGLDRTRNVILGNIARGGGELSQAIVDAVHAFIAPAQPGDDICLVTVEVTPAARKTLTPTLAAGAGER